LNSSKKIYFASDFHLGAPSHEASLAREKKIVRWLESIKKDAEEIFLVGDIFDFWFEYNTVIPKGYVRLLGKIAELTDSGIAVHFFTGNHDMWAFDYLEKEVGVKVYKAPIERTWNNKTFFIGHGDGLGPGDYTYKLLKSIFANKLCQWAFARIHPNLGIGIANFWSRRSRIANSGHDEEFHGTENELLLTFCKEKIKENHFDYFVFGHRHLPLNLKVSDTSTYFNLGEWVNQCYYLEFDGNESKLIKFD
jgi:UDP-2,3-diacylglucosamine hydrolase